MEQRARSASDDGVAESKDLFRGKVALMPLEGGGPSVHLIDSDGKAYPARCVVLGNIFSISNMPHRLVCVIL